MGSALQRLHLSRADLLAIPKDVRDAAGLQLPRGIDLSGEAADEQDQLHQRIIALHPSPSATRIGLQQPSTAPAATINKVQTDDPWSEGPAVPQKPRAKIQREPSEQQQQPQDRAPPVQTKANSVQPAPRQRTGPHRVLLLICYNRPQYLQRTLNKVLEHYPRDPAQQPTVVVSQDGGVDSVTEVAQRWSKKLNGQFPTARFVHWHHSQTHEPGDDGYTKLARHFGWALGKAFGADGGDAGAYGDGGGLGADWVTILEDDLEIAPDFFGYFRAMERVLDADDSLMAASAYNDVGQENFVRDPKQVLRSDFFPGLGWMLGKKTWKEVGPKWPRGYWDDWLREPAQRKGRAFVRPEVSRTRTFGEKGVSMGQFYRQYLANIKLNDLAVDWDREDVSYLQKESYDASMQALVASANGLPPRQATQISCTSGSVRGAAAQAYKVGYQGLGSHGQGYVGVTAPFHFLSDVKAMVPRTAYQGVVRIRYNGCLLMFVPQDMM